MTQHIYENKWNSVRLGTTSSQSGGYNITTTAVSSKWYRRSIEASGQRKLQLRHYYEMDQTSVEISRALDILAEDVSSCNADNEDPFDLVFDENQKYLKSTIQLLENAKDLWKERTKMDTELFNRVRDTLKYGAIFFLKKKDGRLKRIPSERVVGYITDEDDEDLITHYIVDPSIQKLEDLHQHRKETKNFNAATRGDDSKNYQIHPVDDLLVMKIGDGPYGKSVLDTVYKVWRQMSLLEDAVVIYRVVRAPERRVYYIDVGNLQGPKREQAIEKQRLRLMQKQMNRNNQVETEFDPHSTSEDIFIPTNSQGKGSRVETLQGGQSLGELGDVTYFLNKLAAGLRIPNSMIDSQTQERNQFSDMRVGQAYQIEIRYLGHVKRIARYIADTLHDNFVWFCSDRSVVIPEGVKLMLNDPNSFSKYKDMEIYQQTLNLAASTSQMPHLSKKFVLKKYMMMDDEDIIANEDMKLAEFGLEEKTIKTMPPEHRDNIIYGDKSKLADYGIEPQEDQGRFGGF